MNNLDHHPRECDPWFQFRCRTSDCLESRLHLKTENVFRSNKMRPLPLLGALLALCVAVGCVASRNAGVQLGVRTDYVIGRVYQLKKPVFLFKFDPASSKEIPRLVRLGFGATSTDLEKFRQDMSSDPQVFGLLTEGDQVKITKIEEHWHPQLGKLLYVYAVVHSGDKLNQVVEVSMISKEGVPSYDVFVNPEYLAPE